MYIFTNKFLKNLDQGWIKKLMLLHKSLRIFLFVELKQVEQGFRTRMGQISVFCYALHWS